jgi:DeoR/GlpR family transcriptional regulator of sugar metabolism
MLKPERHARIIREINIHNKVLSSDLSTILQVSEDTIRRDLNELADFGKILKVHGGAISKAYHSVVAESEVYAEFEKKAIAQKALSLIQDGMFVLVSSGTTIRTIARQLPQSLKATFFTVSPLTAIDLNQHPNLEVILLGGQLSKDSQITVGGEVIRALADLRVDLCLLGTNGIDASAGITDSDFEIVQVKKAMRKAANKLGIVTISEKLNTIQRLKVYDMNEVNYLITELSPDYNGLDAFRRSDLEIL